jgi:hypothetical protein
MGAIKEQWNFMTLSDLFKLADVAQTSKRVNRQNRSCISCYGPLSRIGVHTEGPGIDVYEPRT